MTMTTERTISRHESPVRGPAFIKTLYNDTRLAWLWLPLRLYVGYVWIESGLRKVADPAWAQTGDALRQFWQNAVKTDPKPVIELSWYRDFIQYLLDTQSYTWFAKLLAYGELLVGIALILGLLTGLAALGGAVMNWNYVMAGSASLNGLVLAIEVFLILAWKTAGWVGLDRWILTYVGTPWSPGRLFRRGPMQQSAELSPVRGTGHN